MRSQASTIEEYLNSLPADRQEIVRQLHTIILENLPEGYEAVMNWGMITYQVPLEVFPQTYNGQPLMYAALASQKNYLSLYLSSIYMDEKKRREFEKAFTESGKRLNAGKSCVRFRKLDDLPLVLIAQTISSTTPAEYVQIALSAQGNRSKSKRTDK